MFLSLGALLYIYASHQGLEVPGQTDQLFPTIALQELNPVVGIVFILGLIAAAYSSADSALTALTTSFCVDFLNFNKSEENEANKKKKRVIVHIAFSLVLLLTIVGFNAINNTAVINGLFVAMPSRKMSDHCNKCGGKNHLRAKYCNNCGGQLPEGRRGRARPVLHN